MALLTLPDNKRPFNKRFILIMANFTPLMPQRHITHFTNIAVIILFIWSLLSDSNWLLCLPNKLLSSAGMLTHSWPEKYAPLVYRHCVIFSVFHSSHFFSTIVLFVTDTVTHTVGMHQLIGHDQYLPTAASSSLSLMHSWLDFFNCSMQTFTHTLFFSVL